MAEILTAIKAVKLIFKLGKGIKTISQLLNNDSGSKITFDDMNTLVRGSHAGFFQTVTVSDMEYTRNWFYNVASVAIKNAGTISASYLGTGGRLAKEYQELPNNIDKLARQLTALRDVLDANQAQLHPDELVSGLIALVNGYGLLFHMHYTYFELHRIQRGVSSLDHSSLQAGTLLALQHLKNASTIFSSQRGRASLVDIIGDMRVNERILNLVKSTSWFSNFGRLPQYYFKDKYDPLSSTPTDRYLSKPRSTRMAVYASSSYRRDMEAARINYVAQVRQATHAVAYQYDIDADLQEAKHVLMERARKQGVTTIQLKPLATTLAYYGGGGGAATIALVASGGVGEISSATEFRSAPAHGNLFDPKESATGVHISLDKFLDELDDEDKADAEMLAKLSDEEVANLEAVTAELLASGPGLPSQGTAMEADK